MAEIDLAGLNIDQLTELVGKAQTESPDGHVTLPAQRAAQRSPASDCSSCIAALTVRMKFPRLYASACN